MAQGSGLGGSGRGQRVEGVLRRRCGGAFALSLLFGVDPASRSTPLYPLFSFRAVPICASGLHLDAALRLSWALAAPSPISMHGSMSWSCPCLLVVRLGPTRGALGSKELKTTQQAHTVHRLTRSLGASSRSRQTGGASTIRCTSESWTCAPGQLAHLQAPAPASSQAGAAQGEPRCWVAVDSTPDAHTHPCCNLHAQRDAQTHTQPRLHRRQ